MEDQSGKDNGKIIMPYKWRDEEGEFDLTNPNDFEKAQQLVNKGYGYQKGQEELKTVKRELEKAQGDLSYWNELILEAEKTGDSSKVDAALEMSGVKRNKSDDEEIMDEGNKEMQEVLNKVQSLEKKLLDSETRQYNAWAADAHTQLEAKYGNGKYPEYNRTEVENFANKKGIREFEDAYFIMNKEELMKAEVKDDKSKSKKHLDKIKKVASKEPGSGEMPPKPMERHTNYGKATEKWLGNTEITESLFIED